jgi:DNA-binding MarR family transcriptional regulator
MGRHPMSIVGAMGDQADGVSPEELRHLFHRKALAGERHRAALARTLRISDTEAAAIAHLASQGQATPGELGALLGLTSGGTTALLHRLEAAGHLARHPHPDDRRSTLLTATPSILAAAEQVYAPLVKEMDEASARLTDHERAIVARYLAEIAAVSERHAERLDAAVRAESADGAAAPVPGLWA